ncbi:hypothetical protein SDC9_195313 [bioreactor metagenome]|uniref:Uncharacterized protein n=1 Tax=bioreactor metagenome TaxID=1076179 RepID=A0A645IB94_9ZZZZ
MIVHHGVDAVRSALDNLNLHIWIVFLERADNVWEPVNGHAGKGSDSDMAGVRSLNFCDTLFQALVGIQQLADNGQQHLPLGIRNNTG